MKLVPICSRLVLSLATLLPACAAETAPSPEPIAEPRAGDVAPEMARSANPLFACRNAAPGAQWHDCMCNQVCGYVKCTITSGYVVTCDEATPYSAQPIAGGAYYVQ